MRCALFFVFAIDFYVKSVIFVCVVTWKGGTFA